MNAPSWACVSPSENFQQNRRQLFLASVSFQVVSLDMESQIQRLHGLVFWEISGLEWRPLSLCPQLRFWHSMFSAGDCGARENHTTCSPVSSSSV